MFNLNLQIGQQPSPSRICPPILLYFPWGDNCLLNGHREKKKRERKSWWSQWSVPVAWTKIRGEGSCGLKYVLVIELMEELVAEFTIPVAI